MPPMKCVRAWPGTFCVTLAGGYLSILGIRSDQNERPDEIVALNLFLEVEVYSSDCHEL